MLLLPPPMLLLLLPQLLFVLAGGGVVGGGGGGSGAVGGGCALPLPPSALPLPRREVVATTFTRVDGEVWTSWDWRSITTVIDVYRFGNETALACAAHRHGARLLLNMGDKELLDWGLNRSRDLENRSAFESLAAKVAAVGADGVSLDIESNAATDPTRQAALRESLTLFTERLRAALRRSNPAAVLGTTAKREDASVGLNSYDIFLTRRHSRRSTAARRAATPRFHVSVWFTCRW